MRALTEALHARLAAASAVTSLVTSYKGAPAIFTQAPIPPGAQLPYVFIEPGSAVDREQNQLDRLGRDLQREIHAYDSNQGATAEVCERLAEACRGALEGLPPPLTVSGWQVEGVLFEGPVVRDDEDAYGRVLTVRLLLRESP